MKIGAGSGGNGRVYASRRDVLRLLGAVEFAAGVATAGESVRSAEGPTGGNPVSISIDPTEIGTIWVAETVSELGAPPRLPAAVMTLDAGLVIAGDDATFERAVTERTMEEAREIQIAESHDELEEPDEYPAIAYTVEDGLFLDFGED